MPKPDACSAAPELPKRFVKFISQKTRKIEVANKIDAPRATSGKAAPKPGGKSTKDLRGAQSELDDLWDNMPV